MRKTQAGSDPSRRQSGRQIRTSTSRPVNYYARPFGSFNDTANEPQDDNSPGFYPAIQFFTDAITALSKEVMRHSTLMKEVEAKIHGPAEVMTQLANRIKRMPVPPRRSLQPSSQALLSFTAHNSSAATSVNGSVINGVGSALTQQNAFGDEQLSQSLQIDPQLDMTRRREFQNLRMVMQSILINLDEKNACLAEANRTLDRQLGRVESVIPHVESEISEEARLGSLSHWAYADNRVKNKPATATIERARRDVAATNNLAAAAATIHEGDIAAVRSEARREAKKSRNQQADSEFEDRPAPKKTQSGKGRKPTDTAAVVGKGLGISNATAAQPQKRRKVEKEGGVAMERSLSGAVKNNKAKENATKPTLVAAEPTKKRANHKPMPVPSLAKKKYVEHDRHMAEGLYACTDDDHRNVATNSPQQSPRLASSPVVANFTLLNEAPGQRSSSARIRQNSSSLQHSTLAEKDQSRPASAAGNKANHIEKRNSVAKGKDQSQEQADRMDVDGQDDRRDRKAQEPVVSDEAGIGLTRTSSRASKISTPNPEHESVVMVRTRSNGVRSIEPTMHEAKTSFKSSDSARSHSRSGSNQHILKQIASFNRSPVLGRRELTTDNDADDSADDESGPGDDQDVGRSRRRTASRRNVKSRTPEEDLVPVRPDEGYVGDEVEEDEENDHDPDDPDEPKYCYCGRGSYGQMIACDNENCEKEWFHLGCTGLKTAPGENGEFQSLRQSSRPETNLWTVKWYCNDCDPKMRKKARPASRM